MHCPFNIPKIRIQHSPFTCITTRQHIDHLIHRPRPHALPLQIPLPVPPPFQVKLPRLDRQHHDIVQRSVPHQKTPSPKLSQTTSRASGSETPATTPTVCPHARASNPLPPIASAASPNKPPIDRPTSSRVNPACRHVSSRPNNS